MRTSILASLAAAGLALACTTPVADAASAQANAVAAATATSVPRAANPLGLGQFHSCVVARRGVTCWGNNSNGQVMDVPTTLRGAGQVSAGGSHGCAVDADGVKCWGSNDNMESTPPALRQPTMVGVGANHSCALDADGVKCWGSNDSMQTVVPTLRRPTLIVAGGDHSCALDADGVKCWGSNDNMESTVPTLRQPKLVTAGANHSCALDADGVKCWGQNSDGETTVPPLRHPRQVVAGGAHTCALDDDGIKCWGANGDGQITVPALRRATQVAVGGKHTCALDDDETVVCWGDDRSKQTEVPMNLSLIGDHVCAISNGVRCAGDNERGQLGVGNDQDQVVALATAGATDLGASFGAPARIASGHGFGCAVNGAGSVKCWGFNADGRLGLGDARDRGLVQADMGNALPALQFGGVAVAKVALGEGHACALGRQGEVFCWGKGSSGELGSEATDDIGTTSGPARPHLKAGITARDLAIGGRHSCILTTDGAVYCWGANDAGQLGIGTSVATGDKPGTLGDAMQPVLLGSGFRVAALASGDRHVCVLGEDGHIKCWGAAEAGQLGLGDANNRGTAPEDMGDALPPIDLGHGQVAVELACGRAHCCAKTIQNTMKCWGDNTQGQLGLGDLAPRGLDATGTGDNLPFVLTPPHERVLSIEASGDRTCARTDSGLRCWGRNTSGELGYGDRDVRGGTLTTIPRLLTPLGI